MSDKKKALTVYDATYNLPRKLVADNYFREPWFDRAAVS
jgi:hypothetical protein